MLSIDFENFLVVFGQKKSTFFKNHFSNFTLSLNWV
jgi:hypothetical protein